MLIHARRTAWAAATAALALLATVAAAGTTATANVRGFEMVSPPDKGGADVVQEDTRVQIASDGSAVLFGSLGGFSDVAGNAVSSDYISRRTGEGWATHGITPAQDPLSTIAAVVDLRPHWGPFMSDDLSAGVFRAWSHLVDAPRVQSIPGAYLRRDLLTPGTGTHQLLSNCPDSVCPTPLPPPHGLDPTGAATMAPRPAGASQNLDRVIFESSLRLAESAPTNTSTKLYASYGGDPLYVGMIPAAPATTCAGAACVAASGSKAGQGVSNPQRYTLRTITRDGSRIFFTATTSGISGALYIRDDQGTTDPADDTTTAIAGVTGATERTPTQDTVRLATFASATPGVDDQGDRVPAKVYFTTAEKLTNDDDNTVVDLYVYDEGRPSGQRLTRLSVDGAPASDPDGDAAGAARGVLGLSDDGDRVYFAAQGQLVAGRPRLGAGVGVYLWSGGAIRYIGGRLGTSDVNVNVPTQAQVGSRLSSRVTSDGSRLLFSAALGDGLLSAHGGTDVDHRSQCAEGICSQLYLYDAVADELVCASCPPGGAPVVARAQWLTRVSASAAPVTSHVSRLLTDDGRLVFFSTTAPLLPAQDTNGKTDVYQYDAESRSLSLISSGTGASHSYFMDATADGSDVLFTTRERLVGWDRDDSVDLYDARVGGGFPEPPPLEVPCLVASCQGPAALAPAGPVVGSAAYRGAGNERAERRAKARRGKRGRRARKRCKGRRVRRRVNGRIRCVKPRHARKADRQRHHRHDGRGARRAAK